MSDKLCELHYGNGGHGGPYTYEEAITAAARRLRGSYTERIIRVVDRMSERPIVVLSKHKDDEGNPIIRISGDNGRLMEQVNPGDQFRHDGILYLGIRKTRVGVLNINAVRVSDGELTEIPDDTRVDRVVLNNA